MKEKFEFRFSRNFAEITAIVTLSCLLIFYVVLLLWPQGNPYDFVKVTIPKGASLNEVGITLKNNNIIHNKQSFQLAVKILGYEKDIPAGRFRIEKASTNYAIIDQLVNGKQLTKKVTIREGWTISMIAKELDEKLGINTHFFEDATHNKNLLDKWGIQAKSFEGYLFPNTYQFNENELPSDIINVMVQEYKRNLSDDMLVQMNQIKMSEQEVLTLASIIEGEAIYDKERAIISGVYHNRLKKGMRLQADPTIQYILEDGPRRLLNRDLKIVSPYNTYLNKGLPPGPINNPGIESIKAALFPTESDYLYFVARGDGYHTFSKTEKQHNKAKRDFQKVRRNAKKLKSKRMSSS
ncbi:MAG: endolytic transglycosylase MltG [Candidatus Neomarinimicrobiota bacterium]|nr:endolytic transglycosylase MltG [Candidatus Neomarinimicrobiota bacterium]